MSILRPKARRIKFARLQDFASCFSLPCESDQDYLASISRVGYAGDCPVSAYDMTPSLPAAEWVLTRVAWHQHQHEANEGIGAHHLCAEELLQLAKRLTGRTGPAVLGYCPRYVPVPDPADYACNDLAREIASQAACLYPFDSAVRRLAARALHVLADLVKFCGSATAAEFIEDEATMRYSAIDGMMEATLRD